MCNSLYIISYHGSDPEVRQKRLDNHNKQIDWWLNYDELINIYILAQDYQQSEYWNHPRVHYIDRLDVPVPPASARNILLNHFYDTDDRWAIFADSDAILNLHPNFEHTHINICDILRSYPENFDDIDLFCPHNDQRPGDGAFYDKYNNVDPAYKNVDWNNELVFDRKLTHMKGTLFFVKNNPERLLMDEYFNVHPNGTKPILGGEDDEFMVRFVMENKGTYMLRNIMLKEMTAGSTWSDTGSRKVDEKLRDDYIAQKYGLPQDRGKWTQYIKKERTGYPKQVVVSTKKVEENSLFSF